MPNYNYPYGMYQPVPQQAQTYPSASTAPYYQTQPYPTAQQYTQYQQPMQNYANAVNNKNIIWVAGQAGAEAYQMEPGSRAVLLDSKDQVFYIKVVGPDGRPEPLMAFKYEPLNLNMQSETAQATPPIDTSNFATKEDLNEIMSYIKQLSNRNSQSTPPKGANKNV